MTTFSFSRRAPSLHGRTQRGIALATALILLIVVMLVGMAAMRGTILQQKMTSNYYDREMAFQAAEAALRQGEAAVTASAGGLAGYRDCQSTSTIKCVPDPFNDTTVTPTQVSSTTSFSTLLGAGNKPLYVIEYLGKFNIPPPNVSQISNCSGYGPCATQTQADFYRITARSGPTDVQGRATVTLQTVFRR